MKAGLSTKDKQFREMSLNGPIGKVVWQVCFPLALYQSLNQFFKILDTMMAAHISSNAVSTVAYLSQIQMTISALGGGLAIGASIKISEAYGAGDFELVKKRVSTLFAVCAVLGLAILAILGPIAPEFLRMAKTPEEFISEGTTYFRLELLSTVVIFFNNVYIAIERARGNSKRILGLNFLVIIVKLVFTAWFVYGLDGGINMISIATILSQLALLAIAVINMNQKDNAFGFSVKAITIKKDVLFPMLHLSFPVIIEKIAFSLGKVVVNSMSTIYGSVTVGALGISNNIGGIVTNPQNGFQEGGSAVISQNIGAGNRKRALQAFYWVLGINIGISILLMTASLLGLNQLTVLFAGDDSDFAARIIEIYKMEVLGTVPLGVNASVMAFLYGFGKTKVTLFINVCRVFVFRIPVLWALQQFTNLGNVSAGIVMAVSNVATGILAVIVLFIELNRLKRLEEKNTAK